jgi:hypothetical protein
MPRLTPLATPLMTSGIPQSCLGSFEPFFRSVGMMPVQAGGVAGARTGPPAKLEPGSAIAIPMMTGDMDLTAVGTVTEVLGDRVLAFGHAFMSEGEASLPMSSGYVHRVIANQVNSFKLGSATGIQGTIFADQTVGISGRIGPAPPTIPIEVRSYYADGTMDQVYRFNASQHPKFTPLLASMAAAVAMGASRELPQHHTLDFDLNYEFSNGQSIRLHNRLANTSAQELFMAIGQPLMAALENPFEKITLKQVTGSIKISREARVAEILFVTYRPFRGPEQIMPLEFELPKDVNDGAYEFAVMDAPHHLLDEQSTRPFRFTAENVNEVFKVLNDLTSVKNDALYLRLSRQPDGIAIGRRAMARLPSSRRKVLTGAGLSNVTPFISSNTRQIPTDYIMTGQATFQLRIDKDHKVETPGRPTKPEPTAPASTPKPDETKPKTPAKPETPKTTDL